MLERCAWSLIIFMSPHPLNAEHNSLTWLSQQIHSQTVWVENNLFFRLSQTLVNINISSERFTPQEAFQMNIAELTCGGGDVLGIKKTKF